MAHNGLFRESAIKEQAGRLEGDVIIAQPLSNSVLTLILLLLVAALITFLTLSSFNRKETVQGYLTPSLGLAKVTTPRAGIIQQRFLNDGEHVIAGAPIALLHIPEHLADGSSLAQGLNRELTQQLALIDMRESQMYQYFQQQVQETERRLLLSEQMLSELENQQALLQQRLGLHERRYENYRQLQNDGAISLLELQQQHEVLLNVQQQHAELNGSRQQQQGLIEQLRGQIERLPGEQAQQFAGLELERSRLQQQQVELTARSEILITAPISGRVTNFVADIGATVSNTQPLLTIIPENTELHAVLLVPTRAYGFVEQGQHTRIRFDAFPYQRFGLYEGEVIRAAQAIVLPGEVDMPVAIQEPVYRVEVALAAQDIRAYGNNVPLQSGMLLSADIVLEQRSLINWLFEPILSLRGQL
ncbi:multidrug resistance efflux pump [Idiomarina sp. A28L]|uniref:HlyD family secretion protein n=1 Tax=Idiomarina sp. A28L TaxID=1036674 RepID=UPI0002138678|nr:HlyD family efflux transporter periplasmic adaptor subunit [Idiomarina sp. A28L]EGN74776.1 multidrug resistance efflux pump [Idiomarina sp. A28L]